MNSTTDMSIQELEEILSKKKKAAESKALKEKKEYESSRDSTIEDLIDEAREISRSMQRFRTKVDAVMEEQHSKLDGYGQIRSNSKGGFAITHSEGDARIRRRLDSEPDWDERSLKGVGLIKEFLFDKVKKRDKKTFELLMSFLVKNKKGDLEYSMVMQLLQHENLYDDQRWAEGLKLLREGYKLYYKGFSYDFQVKDFKGAKWKLITLNFSQI